jgi:hypothetical protein
MGYFFSFISLSRSATETGLDGSEITLLLCGLVLAYGVAGEYILEHGTLPSWMKWSGKPKLVFVWMVALSLVGEFVGDAGVFVFSGHLQAINDAETSALNKEAGDARRDAGNANKAASEANALTKQYQAQIADANARAKQSEAESAKAMEASAASDAKAEGFRLQIAKANESAEGARADAAKTNLELAKIKTPRTLGREQLDRIRATASLFKGTPFDLWVNLDSDSTALMYLLDEVLRSAGWIFTQSRGGVSFDNKAVIMASSGVVIEIAEERRPDFEHAASLLTSALIAEGISAVAHANSSDPAKNKSVLHVMIGSKPTN